MAKVEIRIPQLGEGLQEARIVRFLKTPGDAINRDEPIFEMETDKAVMEIESPAAGVLAAWEAQEDQILAIGAVIGSIETEGVPAADSEAPERAAESKLSPSATLETTETPDTELSSTVPERERAESLNNAELMRNAFVSPRTRAYAREKGLSDDELTRLVQASEGRLLPDSIDRYLARPATRPPTPETATQVIQATGTGFRDVPLPQRQRTLVYRLQRATKDVIPATMEMRIGWGAIESVRAQLKQAGGVHGEASQFMLFAWCVARASRGFPQFRSSLINDSTLREFDNLHLGIAVARPDDELLMARIENADTLTFVDFISAAHTAIRLARNGNDQTTDAMQLSLTNMSGAGVRMGIPIIAAPAAGTLFVGEVFDDPYPLPGGGIRFQRSANMVLSFDHRIANGIGAANFLTAIRERVEGLRDEFSGPAI